MSYCLSRGGWHWPQAVPAVFHQRQGAGNAMAAASFWPRFPFGSRVQRLQFIWDKSRRRNTGTHLEKGEISAFQSQCIKQQVHNGHFGRSEMRQCFQASGFTLISLPRKFIICWPASATCTVAFKLRLPFPSLSTDRDPVPLEPAHAAYVLLNNLSGVKHRSTIKSLAWKKSLHEELVKLPPCG